MSAPLTACDIDQAAAEFEANPDGHRGYCVLIVTGTPYIIVRGVLGAMIMRASDPLDQKTFVRDDQALEDLVAAQGKRKTMPFAEIGAYLRERWAWGQRDL